jgi:hypothetical protein
MNYDTFRAESLGPRWPWENSGLLRLCLMDRRGQALEAELIGGIRSMLVEFELPLEVKLASSRTLALIETLLTACKVGSDIHCWRFLETLNRIRKGEPSLKAGLVIAFDGIQAHLHDESPYKPDEPPEWGWTQDDGLILLRLTPAQSLRSLVRHEMGHLLGIGKHHEPPSDCVMMWDCTRDKFCAECRQTISEACQTRG